MMMKTKSEWYKFCENGGVGDLDMEMMREIR